jgi:adenine-specific DNA-methyltransferase
MSILHNKLPLQTPNLTAQNIDKIAALFPNCITEMLDEEKSTPDHKVYKRGINFELLKQMLSPDVVDGDEAYEFTWVGKKASIVEANKPIRKTLRPCPAESKNWDDTENLYIEGDNLEVLKLLQESYLGKVKMIYIDPPYNTGNDFIYADDFMRSQDEENRQMGMYDEDENRLFKNNDSNGRFHSDWCSMMYSRLMLARNLLTDDGLILISLDDGEIGNLRKICDEIFGESNFVTQFVWKSRQNKDNRNLNGVSVDHEYILAYSKLSGVRIFKGEERSGEGYSNPDNDPNGAWASANMAGIATESQRPNLHYDLINPATGINYGRPKMGWRYDRKTMAKLIAENKILWPDSPSGRPRKKTYLNELSGNLPGFSSVVGENLFTRSGTVEIDSLFEQRIFNFPKPSELIKCFVSQITAPSDIILDFFSGSATSAHAVMRLNAEDSGHRKFIMVQLPELCDEKSEAYKAGYKTICDIGKERIRRAGDNIISERNTANAYPPPDVGFRVFKLDTSSVKDVYYSTDEYSQTMLTGLESNIKEDRTDLDLLFGCLLDWGLPLSMPYRSEKIGNCTVHTYAPGDAALNVPDALIACFDSNVPENVIKEIAKRKPRRAVFRDSSFASSPEKINVFEIFKLYAPDTDVKVI